MIEERVRDNTTQQALESTSDTLLHRSPLMCPENERALSLLKVESTLHLKPNLLLKSAQLLLSFASSCRGEVPPIPGNKIKDKLVEAIHHLMVRAKADGYQNYELMAARYLLCALLDELIINSSWSIANEWRNSGLLVEFAQEPIASDRFFQVLKRCCDDPNTHLDLLELGYYCLSLGFMGSYRDVPGGVQIIAQVRDRLYRLMSLFRGEPKAVFFWGDKPNIPRQKSFFSKFWRARAMGIIWTMVLLSIALLYFPYQYHLHLLAKPIHASLQEKPVDTVHVTQKTHHDK